MKIAELHSAILVSLLACALSGCGDKASESAPVEMGGSGPGGDKTVYVSENPQKCSEDSECNDGNACNGVESCEGGICIYGDAVNCNDGIACTRDACDAKDGKCTHTAPDEDGDGHGDADCLGEDALPLGDDCDDADPGRYPGNLEVCAISLQGDSTTGIGDGKDEDCDPSTFGDRDVDGDGYVDTACFNEAEDGQTNSGNDCNDLVASISPEAAEDCDHFDNNCNGEIDEGKTVKRYDDPDGDGYGGIYDPDDPETVTLVERDVCPWEVRVTIDETDCAPEDRLISPDRDELCDGVDNNCNGEVDENVVPSTWYRDFDRDGYGNPEGGVKSTCERIDHLGWSLFQGDCDDSNPLVNPGQVEICDGLDNDCQPETRFVIAPGNTEDDDGDSFADPLCGTGVPDCDDENATVYPGAPELCDQIDNDCNMIVDTRTSLTSWYEDQDLDGFGVAAGVIESCEPIAGRVTKKGDCDDTESRTNPGALDDCSGLHGVDDDCDGQMDEAETPVYSFRDLDGDGYGQEEVVSFCQPVLGDEYVNQGNDCDDSDTSMNPGATEDCSPDSVADLDCDGDIGCADSQCVAAASCQALYGLALVSPAAEPIVAFCSSTFEVTVSLTDPDLNPIYPANIHVAGEPGSLVPDAPVATDASGNATFSIGVGMAEGPYTFTLMSGTTAPLQFTVDAQLPNKGMVWTVLNRGGERYQTQEGSFGPGATLYYPRDIDVMSDGSAFVAGYYDVGLIDPVGQFTIIAGNGSSSLTGDGLPALSAGLGYPYNIAVDEAGGKLYIATSTTVRVVNLNADPPTIHAVMGEGEGPIPGLAALTDVGTIEDLAVLPNGHLLVSSEFGVLEYDPSPGSKQIDFYGINMGSPTSESVTSYSGSYRLGLWQDGERSTFWGRYLWGEEYGSSYASGISGFFGGESYRLIGRPTLAPNSLMTEGAPMESAHLQGGTPSSAVRDSAGHLLFAPGSYFNTSLWKVDTITQRATRFAGQHDVAGAIGDEYVTRLDSEFRGSLVTDIGPDGDVWVAEYHSYGRVRRIRGAGVGEKSELHIEVLTPDDTQYWPGQALSGVASLVTDADDGDVTSAIVRQVPSSGWKPLFDRKSTDVDGVAFTGGNVELTPGEYSLQTRLLDLDRELIDAGVHSYEVVRPPSGSVTTWMNVAQTSSATSQPEGQPALTTSLGILYGITTTSDGTVYVSASAEGNSVFAISPDGYLSRVAGGNGGGTAGDFLPALDAQLLSPTDLVVDEDEGLLYILLGSSTTQHIRVVDFNTGIIYPFAGYGTETGYGVPVLERAGWDIFSMHLNEGQLYLSHAAGIDVVDTTVATPLIESWTVDAGVASGCTAEELIVNYCTDRTCRMAFRDDGKVYLQGYLCGMSVTNSAWGVALLSADGEFESLVSGFGNTVANLPHSALNSSGTGSSGMALDSAGNLYFSEESRHWLRRIEPGGDISTAASTTGNPTGGTDFISAEQARFYTPRAVATLPDDSVLILDYSNYSIRRYWP